MNFYNEIGQCIELTISHLFTQNAIKKSKIFLKLLVRFFLFDRLQFNLINLTMKFFTKVLIVIFVFEFGQTNAQTIVMSSEQIIALIPE